MPSLIKKGGVLVLVSPHSWLAAWTPKEKWVGGFVGKVRAHGQGRQLHGMQGRTAAA